jgi:hypothetical protein
MPRKNPVCFAVTTQRSAFEGGSITSSIRSSSKFSNARSSSIARFLMASLPRIGSGAPASTSSASAAKMTATASGS